MRRARSGRRVALALGLGVPVVLLVALEFALRAAGYGPAPRVRAGATPGGAAPAVMGEAALKLAPTHPVLRPDRDLGFALAAGFRAAPCYAGPYALSSWPWRGRPALPAPDDVLRVVVLGDSCAYGLGLDTADTLAHRVALHLEERGLPRERVQVLNHGVPGHSLAQTARVLDDLLQRFDVHAVVLYVGAWNDQVLGSGGTDDSVLARIAARTWIDDTAIADLVTDWRDGGRGPDRRTRRVPASEVEPRVRALLARARAAGAQPVVVLPAHRASTTAERPALLEDRAAVRRAALADGAALVDAQACADTSGLPEHALFVDFVHPSPLLWERVTPKVAARLTELLPPVRAARDGGDAALRVVDVAPRSVTSLGGERVRVALAGLAPSDPPPVLVVGGAALLDVRREGDAEVSALVPTNRPGTHDLLVQTAAGTSVARAALTLAPPRLERTDAGLVVHARAGDRADVFVARGRVAGPMFTLPGAGELDLATLLAAPIQVAIGADGSASVPLPPGASGAFAQALIVPCGDEALVVQGRLTAAIEL